MNVTAKKSNPVVSFLIRFVLSAGLLVYLFSKIDWQKTFEVLREADLYYIIAAGVVFFFINLILLWRWNTLIKALRLSVHTMNVVRYFFIGLFGNLFLPSAIGGDVIKIIGLCRETDQKPRVVASVLLDRLSGFASMVIVAVSAFVVGWNKIDDMTLAIPVVGMGVVSCIVAVVLFNERAYEFGCRIFNMFPKVKKALMDIHYDVALLKDNKAGGFKAIALSCLSQVTLIMTYYLIAKGLRQDIHLIYFFIFVPLICVASSFPSIGGLGVREAGAAYLFSKIGIGSGIAVSMSLLNFLFMVAVGLMGGLIYVFTVSPGRVQHHAPDAGLKPKNA